MAGGQRENAFLIIDDLFGNCLKFDLPEFECPQRVNGIAVVGQIIAFTVGKQVRIFGDKFLRQTLVFGVTLFLNDVQRPGGQQFNLFPLDVLKFVQTFPGVPPLLPEGFFFLLGIDQIEPDVDIAADVAIFFPVIFIERPFLFLLPFGDPGIFRLHGEFHLSADIVQPPADFNDEDFGIFIQTSEIGGTGDAQQAVPHPFDQLRITAIDNRLGGSNQARGNFHLFRRHVPGMTGTD